MSSSWRPLSSSEIKFSIDSSSPLLLFIDRLVRSIVSSFGSTSPSELESSLDSSFDSLLLSSDMSCWFRKKSWVHVEWLANFQIYIIILLFWMCPQHVILNIFQIPPPFADVRALHVFLFSSSVNVVASVSLEACCVWLATIFERTFDCICNRSIFFQFVGTRTQRKMFVLH